MTRAPHLFSSTDTPDPFDIPGLVDRYLAGEGTPAERAFVEAWADSTPERRAVLRGAQEARRGIHQGMARRDVKGALAQVRRRFAEGQSAPQSVRSGAIRLGRRAGKTFQLMSGSGAALALGLCILLLGGTGLWSTLRPSRVSNTARTYMTVAGQRSAVRLADGSQMTLAPSSSAVVTSNGVTVTGEAYFTVVSHPTRPFVVRTTNAMVQVLGTRFSVRHYPEEQESRVLVEDGRVTLRALGSNPSSQHAAQTILSARMLALVADSGITVTSGVTTRDYTSWTQGRLVFDTMPLRHIVAELARAYGVDIRVADTTLAKNTMRLDVSVNDESIDQVLVAICKALNAHVVRSGRAYVLSPGRGPSGARDSVPQRRHFPQPEQQYGR